MFTDLRIKNFRLFDDLKIDELRRVNLFVGKNNAGKTAVLEAVAMVAAGEDLDNARGFEIRAAHTDQRHKIDVDEQAKGKGPPPPIAVEYIPPNIDLADSDAERLIELRKQRRADDILNALRGIEPRIKSVPEVLVSEGSTKVFCDIGAQELMPLGLMGAGTTRILRLLVRMERPSASNAGNGRVCIVDEIDNGFHHETLGHMWQVLDEASRRNATQVFATTHSRECLEAAYKAIIDLDDLAIHRLETDRNGASRCVTLTREAIEGTMRHGFEVR